MCLIVFAFQAHPEYPLIVAANRDEFFARPTMSARWWTEAPRLLAGRDLQAGGAWMGVTCSGRFAAVTNIREQQRSAAEVTRGQLVRRYLEEEMTCEEFSTILQQTRDQYQGYNLLYGGSVQLNFYSNRNNDRGKQIQPGIYGLSNAHLNTPWPKVETAKKLLQEQITMPTLNTEKLLTILAPTDLFRDELLPDTGVSLGWERRLSAIRITGADYATRSSTVLLFGRTGQIDFHERTFSATAATDVRYSFQLQQ